MMSPGLSVWMSSFCGPAIDSACFTAFCSSWSDMSTVRVGFAAAAGGGASACGRGGGAGGGTGEGAWLWDEELRAWVAPSERCAGGGVEKLERCCVEDSRLPL